MFGDEIAIRAQTLVHDAAQPGRGHARRDGLRDRRPQPGGARRDRPDDPGDRPRVGGLQLLVGLRGGRHARRSGSTSAPASARRCAFTFERWNGNGYPDHVEGEAIPLADAHRAPQPRHGGDRPPVLAGPRARGRARPPRPHVRPGARRPVPRARTRAGSTGSRETEPWDAVLALEPEPHRMLAGAELDDALTVVADFIDLKSPYMGGHSRRCAELAADAARVLGLADEDVDGAAPRRARARLRHHRGAELDLGQAGPAHADGVRSRRAPPDADRADAAPLAGAGRPEPGRVRAPREVRRVRLPQARARRRRRRSTRACWRRRRSTSA